MGLKPRRRRTSRAIVVEDATTWGSNATRAGQALAGVLAAIERVYGPDALDLLNECGMRHAELGLRPLDFAVAVLGATDGQGVRPWSS